MIASFPWLRTPLRCGAVLLCSLAVADLASAAGDVSSTQTPGAASKAAPSRVVREGGVERPLWIDSGRVMEFNKPGTNRPVMRPAEAADSRLRPKTPAEGASTAPAGGSSARADADRSGPSGKSDEEATRKDTAQVSPIFVDSSGQPRALPGGVIVSFREVLPEAQARARLQETGLTPLRQLGARMWLVDSPVGVASLDLAERLQGDQRFEFAQPNWWRPRATK